MSLAVFRLTVCLLLFLHQESMLRNPCVACYRPVMSFVMSFTSIPRVTQIVGARGFLKGASQVSHPSTNVQTLVFRVCAVLSPCSGL